MYGPALEQAMQKPPNSLGIGAPPPKMPGTPPAATGIGAVPTGSPGKTKMTAGGEAIAALRDLQGFMPEQFNQINEWISQIKQSTMPKPGENPGPGLGKPGVPGAAQLDAGALADSGNPGAM